MAGIDRICDNQDIVPRAMPSIHDAIISWFSAQKRGTVLDAPAGYGYLGVHLRDMGYDVTCGEIDTKIFKDKDLRCIYTDLNEKIDSPDGAFDYICCVDGLEHTTNPYKAVEEFARVLKPGGVGIFSMPNYSNIHRRVKFFLNGYLTLPLSFEEYLKSGRNLFNFHNSPLTITIIDLIFKINGLKVEGILRDTVKWKQYFWFPLVFLLKLHSWFQSDSKWKRHRYDLTLRNDVILGSSTLIFITRKVPLAC
jgi:SAM-dependent methyltransferase